MECIVLAGGLGTRLRSSIGDHPKCMALVNGQPFLHFVFRYLAAQGCRRVILSLGYKHEVITDWLAAHSFPFVVDWVVEAEPLGTGGAIKLSMEAATAEHVVVLNGDTFFDVPLGSLHSFQHKKNAETTLALKHMTNFDRYGAVKLDDRHCIVSFEEKKFCEEGMINGGVYIINRARFIARSLPQRFSFEKDYLEAYVQAQAFFGSTHTSYFIDIGIPDDYQQAQTDFITLFQ